MRRIITDKELAEFTAWYFDHFECCETFQAYFTISMAGYLHSYEKETKRLLRRCKVIGLVSVAGGMVRRTENDSASQQRDDIRQNDE